MEYLLKSVQNPFFNVMKAAVGLQKHQEDQNQGSWVGLGTLLGLILKGPRGSEASQKGFGRCLNAPCLKTWFFKDVINEITTFGGSLDLKTCLKLVPKHALSVGYSNFDCDNIKVGVKNTK